MPPKPLDAEEREKLYADFAYVFTPREIDERIEEAMNHRAVRKVEKSIYLYCRNWIRTAATRERPDMRPHVRDVSEYFKWPDGRAR